MTQSVKSRGKLVAAFVFGVAVALGGNLAVTGAIANQPNMENALNSLRAARASLDMAEPNKGGHRDVAISLVDQAIVQVKEGIAYAR
ncbi:MAG: hypothetical protein B7Z15_11400 [Rhizobiales bacterium 32-66-8]|nr:MAG: hypothetical protein B7Z15_11400 [Rhizobiales bacterium 32-66-8]